MAKTMNNALTAAEACEEAKEQRKRVLEERVEETILLIEGSIKGGIKSGDTEIGILVFSECLTHPKTKEIFKDLNTRGFSLVRSWSLDVFTRIEIYWKAPWWAKIAKFLGRTL